MSVTNAQARHRPRWHRGREGTQRMARVVISIAESNLGGYGDKYPFRPCLWARQGEVDILRAWVELDGMIGEITAQQLEAQGLPDPGELLKKAMLRYGIRRFEAVVRELLSSGGYPGAVSPTWTLGRDERPLLLSLAVTKTCDYQARVRRDIFCTIPSAGDPTARVTVEGRPAAP